MNERHFHSIEYFPWTLNAAFFFLFVLALPDEIVRQDFLEEIQLMKAVGSHKNIVNMVGCCTVEEPMFLLVEYVPYGDLLHYLRKRRGKVHTIKESRQSNFLWE